MSPVDVKALEPRRRSRDGTRRGAQFRSVAPKGTAFDHLVKAI